MADHIGTTVVVDAPTPVKSAEEAAAESEALPPAIRELEEHVKQIEAEAAANPVAAPTDAPANIPAPPTAITPPAPIPAPVAPVEAPQRPQLTPMDQPATEDLGESDSDARAKAEHAASVQKGRFDKERTELKGELDESKTRITELEKTISDQKATSASAATKQSIDAELSALSDEEFAQEAGISMDQMEVGSRDFFQAQMASQRSDMASLEKRLLERVEAPIREHEAKRSDERFYDDLEKATPDFDWRKVDKSVEFNDWLKKNPGKRDLYDLTIQNGMALGTADIQKDFANDFGLLKPELATASVESQVMPSPAAPSAMTAQTPGQNLPVYTMSEINVMANELNKGNSMHFPTLVALDAEISSAMAQKRIRDG